MRAALVGSLTHWLMTSQVLIAALRLSDRFGPAGCPGKGSPSLLLPAIVSAVRLASAALCVCGGVVSA